MSNATTVKLPHADVDEYTRVPVAAAYVAVNALLFTSMPVTSPAVALAHLPPAPCAVVDRPSHEPGVPEAVVLNASAGSGFAAVVAFHAPVQNKQPAVQ